MNEDTRIGQVLNLIYRLAEGDLGAREVPSDRDDDLDAIIAGLNMLAEELEVAKSTLTTEKQELEELNDRLIKTQAQLVETSKMSALGQMAGGVAHEINSPLGIIHLISGQLRELMSDEHLDRNLVTEMAEQIESTALRIAKIVSGLRAFARDGSSDPFAPVNVHQLITDTLAFCGEKFKQENIHLDIGEISSGLSVECRPSEISQVLLNLLLNAQDATEPMPVRWVKITAGEIGERVEIAVSDSGPGIPAETAEKMFQPFFTTKEVGKGTGLGLSISLGIVATHKGTLRIDTNSPNTRFILSLPKKHGETG